MENLVEIRSAILANAEPHEIAQLRAKWTSQQQVAPKVVSTAANYIEGRVAEKRAELKATQLEKDRQETLRQSYELKTKNDLFKAQFKDFILHNAATVSNGELHFEFNGQQYSVSLKDQVYSLTNADGSTRKLLGDGPASEKLVYTLATL